MTTPTSELAVRATVAFALIGLGVAALLAGGFGFWLVTAIVGVLMMGEWAALTGAGQRQKRLAQYALSVPLAILCPLAAGPGFFAIGLLVGAAFFIAAVTRNPRLAGGALYIGLPILALLLLRAQPDGLLLTFWAMGLVSACDTGALFAGRSLRGPLLAPAISPAKTWSGLIGGTVAATVFAALLMPLGLPLRLVLVTALLALLAQAGDLFESSLKRRAGVKDSGTILPGHGGLLDRLDGLVPVAPAAVLLVLLPAWIS